MLSLWSTQLDVLQRHSSNVRKPVVTRRGLKCLSLLFTWCLAWTITSTAFAAEVPAPERDGDDWPCFLGPHHSGVSNETGLLDSWPASGPPRIWDREVGTGYSAPSVQGNRLVIHHRLKDEEIVECLRADTGETLWRHSDPSHFEDPYGYNNGPRCSPVLTKDRCYTLGAEGRLLCLSLHDGAMLWKRELKQEYTIPDGFFGVGSSPLLEEDKLIVMVGGQPNSGVVAFDSTTGQPIWKNVGKSTWDKAKTGWPGESEFEWTNEEMVVSYSSPLCATIHGRRHLLCFMRQGLVSLDPATGKEWFHFWFRPRVHESVNAAQPVVDGNSIMLSAAYRLGAVRLLVKPDGQSYEIAWKNSTNLLTHWSTSIFHEGVYYGFSGRHENEGMFRCLQAETGEVLWETAGATEDRLRQLKQAADGKIVDTETNQPVPWPLYGRASKIMVDGKFIILAERGGMLSLVKVDQHAFQEISRCEIDGMHYPSWTAPVLSRGRLYLRSEDRLICLDLKK